MNFPPESELEITTAEVEALLAAGTPLRLIDCREPDEWQLCHLHGAELVPLSSFAETAPARFKDPAEAIVIHCHHGMRSARATAWLRARGFPRTWSMAGGIDLWSETIDPAIPRY